MIVKLHYSYYYYINAVFRLKMAKIAPEVWQDIAPEVWQDECYFDA